MTTLIKWTIIGLISFSVSGQTIKNPIGQDIPVEDINAFFDKQMEATGTPGVSLAIINDGKIVYHTVKGYSAPDTPISPKTIFEGASLSKPLFAFFVMQLVEDGVLDLDTPLYTYLPYKDIAHDERYKKITARMVLSHTTGFPNWRNENGRTGLTIDFEPGTQFQYSGEGYQYLALVLQELLKTDPKGLQKRFHKQIAKPFGLDVTRYIPNTKNQKNKAQPFKNNEWLPITNQGKDEFGAAYGVNSEAKDWAKLIIAWMNKEGLSNDGYAELFKKQTALPDDNPNRASGISHLTLGFYNGTFPFGDVYGHGGNNNKRFTSLFFFIPESKWGAVLFTNSGFGEQMGIEFFQYILSVGN
ncbi:hypothetical protein GCM10011344_46030 [Dokdonia pacifica]|uniref:CubicO group peptidase, beta-lactamase class C family n=1 Tax=Dokdonia pacifica TaxID=1627892 RepID=A0A239DCE3_9FLAO|nr:serine hydrolase domain-containing protein [Dokdonia pacifica]GGG39964.1 hypothetical protein GCM10011344_46030 [Dokdonia pacifica]SNS30000.1 CubicO group peptidase, beta-lactamase class C family [Dokdonia pacifica]